MKVRISYQDSYTSENHVEDVELAELSGSAVFSFISAGGDAYAFKLVSWTEVEGVGAFVISKDRQYEKNAPYSNEPFFIVGLVYTVFA